MSYGHQGKEQDAGIYTRYMIRMVRAAYALAQLVGHGRLAAAARRWIRARVGTWLTTAIEGRSLIPSPAIRSAWRGPGALVARDPAHVTSLAASVTVPNAGARSLSTQNDGSMRLSIDSLAGVYLSEALGLPGQGSSLTRALRNRWPDRPALWGWCLTDEERALALRGLRGDDAALADVVDRLAGDYPWRWRKTIGRAGARRSFVVVHELAVSSTPGTNLAQGEQLADGLVAVECLTAQYGARKSGDPDAFAYSAYAVGPSVATIVGDVVRAQRTDDKPYPLTKDGPATMEHPTVERRLVVHPDAATLLWSQGPEGLRLLRGPGVQTAPPPEEIPMPEPLPYVDVLDWIPRPGEPAYCTGSDPAQKGTWAGFQALDLPNTAILRNGANAFPWATSRITWDDDWVYLIDEVRYSEATGQPTQWRRYRRDVDTYGIPLMPRRLARDGSPVRFRIRFLLLGKNWTEGGQTLNGTIGFTLETTCRYAGMQPEFGGIEVVTRSDAYGAVEEYLWGRNPRDGGKIGNYGWRDFGRNRDEINSFVAAWPNAARILTELDGRDVYLWTPGGRGALPAAAPAPVAVRPAGWTPLFEILAPQPAPVTTPEPAPEPVPPAPPPPGPSVDVAALRLHVAAIRGQIAAIEDLLG